MVDTSQRSAPTADDIRGLLRDFRDPHRDDLDVVDLGLVYDLRVCGGNVAVVLSLTKRDAEAAQRLVGAVEARLLAHPGVDHATVRVVWDPEWNPAMITPEGRQRLEKR